MTDCQDSQAESITTKWTSQNTNLSREYNWSDGRSYKGDTDWCAKVQLIARTKRIVRDATRLFSPNWSKTTFIFRIRSVATLGRCQRLVSLKMKMRNVVFKSITNIWPLCDSTEIYPVIHLLPICRYLGPICNLSMIRL